MNAVRAGDVPEGVLDHLGRFKSFTTNASWKLGFRGALWQKSSYDRVLDMEKPFEEVVQYVLDNPVRKGFVADWTQWPYAGIVDAGDRRYSGDQDGTAQRPLPNGFWQTRDETVGNALRGVPAVDIVAIRGFGTGRSPFPTARGRCRFHLSKPIRAFQDRPPCPSGLSPAKMVSFSVQTETPAGGGGGGTSENALDAKVARGYRRGIGPGTGDCRGRGRLHRYGTAAGDGKRGAHLRGDCEGRPPVHSPPTPPVVVMDSRTPARPARAVAPFIPVVACQRGTGSGSAPRMVRDSTRIAQPGPFHAAPVSVCREPCKMGIRPRTPSPVVVFWVGTPAARPVEPARIFTDGGTRLPPTLVAIHWSDDRIALGRTRGDYPELNTR